MKWAKLVAIFVSMGLSKYPHGITSMDQCLFCSSIFLGNRIKCILLEISSEMGYLNSVLLSSGRVEVKDAPVSGGGLSGRFSYGYSTFKGKRASMEDFYETRISEVDGQMVAFFGVFDGHGGSRVAEYLKSNLFNNVSNHPDFVKDPKSAIVEAFKQTDTDYLNEDRGQLKDAGSTASAAFLVGNRLYVANVGDSRVVACRSGSAIPLSIDHKPERSDERERIENAGGFVIWAGTWRVGGVLAVSRAFGDKLLKPYVVAEPEIQEEEIEVVEFFIIASDGLWNVVSNKDAVEMVRAISDTETASRNLIQEAYYRGSNDNITCIVVRFNNP
ncbi:hypothetical protein J5N97_021114 [Dioscorea zingiberensis]|uniref:protein-serine/threonine phosphatase n=1 Tax=Dioscorea zingiberensis TaxID=325984 RepID=A0A9D5HE98_9LILI|nr:hypothetical protein J5N97_021114 [Dioscorea zingiberensis]